MTNILNDVEPLHAARSGQLPDLGSRSRRTLPPPLGRRCRSTDRSAEVRLANLGICDEIMLETASGAALLVFRWMPRPPGHQPAPQLTRLIHPDVGRKLPEPPPYIYLGFANTEYWRQQLGAPGVIQHQETIC
jgi:hypothetical protein